MSADFAPKPAIDFGNMDYHKEEDNMTKYNRSKLGNLIHAAEFDRRFPESNIVSVSLNPGLLKTNLQRNFGAAQKFQVKLVGKPAKYGAYTELFAGLDSSITSKDKWITPFGRREEPRADIVEPELGKRYWDWCKDQVRSFL
ncbi:hypothetical protein VDGD_07272 [Verticillium dahliae]|nr:hypothetical protein VDGD_07272 [Verticillium dahliae]